MALVRAWGPYFRIRIGMSRNEMLDLSIPELIDLIDYEREMRSSG